MNACWKRVVKDWEEVDLSRGHYIPLKDWKASWYTGPNRTCFGVQYHKHKPIALEFIEGCGCNESMFLKKWPVADTGGPSILLDAIQAEQIASGSAKPHNSKLWGHIFKDPRENGTIDYTSTTHANVGSFLHVRAL
ncbi:hypothetical protein K439DRAFT_1613804 [Ramaria rubella]|nr:hypothetical protein K439DRAFT_1613804 [Ramaria rubella]